MKLRAIVLALLMLGGCATTGTRGPTGECLAGTAGFLAKIGLAAAGIGLGVFGDPLSWNYDLPTCPGAGASEDTNREWRLIDPRTREQMLRAQPPQSEESPPSTEGGGAR